MSAANRGKYAEGKVREFLEQWKQQNAAFTYNRITDARSAMGAMSNPQPGDFQWFMKGTYTLHPHELGVQFQPIQGIPFTRNGLIEVKEVYHDFRLPHKNFAIDQVGRMKIRQMAGSECVILTCHRVEGQRGAAWRSIPVDFFSVREGGSWDLRQFETQPNAADFLKEYLS